MTKEKFLSILLVVGMLLITIIPTTVEATEGTQDEVWTDLSKAQIEIVPKATGDNIAIENATSIDYYIKISNVELNPASEYRVYFHYKGEEITKNKILFSNHAVIKGGETETQINTVTIKEFLQKSEDIYVSIIESKENSNNIIVTARKMERPELLPKLGNRAIIYFYSTNTNTFFYAPCYKVTRKINIKIGQVTDTELLKKVKENNAQGLKELLQYAKNTKNYNYVGDILYKDQSSGITESLTSKMNLTDGAYYFAYIELDDENGVYYPVEDIALYKAKGTNNLTRYSDKDFTWVFPEENKPVEDNKQEQDKTETPSQEKPIIETTVNDKNSNTQKDPTQAPGVLPKTGEKAIYIAVLLMAIVSIFVYIKYRQYRDIK